MGVHGLSTYISERSELYLQPHELCDCHLVVDGSNIACSLFRDSSDSSSAFGGDYDEYYRTVKRFFRALKTCNVTPIVLFDGGYEKKKLRTTLERSRSTVLRLKPLTERYSDPKIRPLLFKSVFFDVMEELGVTCIQCDFEADVELAAVARALKCPVLSYDSDFFIYDVLYIPFPSLSPSPVKRDSSNNHYLRCFIYDVTNFLSKFHGLDRSLLPVIATLLGNDYANSSIFDKFFLHVTLPQKKSMPHSQKKVHGVLHWLEKENLQSAVKGILLHLKAGKAREVLKAIESNTEVYTDAAVSESVHDLLKAQLGDLDLQKKPSQFHLPPQVKNLFIKCRVNKFLIDMITLRTYCTAVQVEDLRKDSSHCPSVPLIADMYAILSPYLKGPPRPLKLHLILKTHFRAVSVKSTAASDLQNVTIDDLLGESREVRLKWLCGVVGVEESDLEMVPTSDWSLFVLSVIYWIQKCNREVCLAHVHALVLMAMANRVVQRSVGYFESLSKFMKSKGRVLSSWDRRAVVVAEGKDFGGMVEGVSLEEKLHVHGSLMPLRKPTEKATGKAYCVSTVHLFGAFQSCLMHVMQVNALLDYPLPHLRVSDFYSGTLLFNLYLSVKAKPGVERFGCNLFKDTPNLKAVYTYLWESLCDYSDKTAVVEEAPGRRRKKKRKKKEPEEKLLLHVCGEDDDEADDYDDPDNPYAALRGVAGM